MRPCGPARLAKIRGGPVGGDARGPASGPPRFGLSGSTRGIGTFSEASASPRARLPPRRERSWRHLAAARTDLALLAAGIPSEMRPETLVRAAVEIRLLPHRGCPSERHLRFLERRIECERAVERPDRERGLKEREMRETFRVPEPRRLPDSQSAIGPEDRLAVIALFFGEVRSVRHRIDAIRIEVQCLLEAAGGVGFLTESKQGGAFVVPRRGVLRPKGEDLLVALDCCRVILQFMERGTLVDPCVKRPRVERQQPIVRFGLLLQPAEFVQHGRKAHPGFLRVPVALQRLHEGVEGAFPIARLLEDGAFEEPRRVVLRLEPEGGAELTQGGFRVSSLKRAPRGMQRGLEAIHARQEPLCRVGRRRHSFASDATCRAHVSRHFLASSWFGFRESARSYASSASRNRSSCWRATPFPVHASAFRRSRSIACSYRRSPICGRSE